MTSSQDKIQEELDLAEGFISKWWNKLRDLVTTFLDTPKKKFIAFAVFVFAVWMWGQTVASATYNALPSSQTMIGVMPATNNALAQQDAKIDAKVTYVATTQDEFSRKIEALANSIVNLQRAIVSLVGQGVAVENRVDVIESKLTPDPKTTTGSLPAKRHKPKSQ